MRGMMKHPLLFLLTLFLLSLGRSTPVQATLPSESPTMENILATLNGNVSQQAKLLAEDRADALTADYFGYSLAISGARMTSIIGAPRDHTVAGVNTGSVYVFR